MITATTHIVKTVEDFQRLKKYAKEVPSPYLVMDCESDSEIERKAKLYGIGLCFNSKRAFYIPFRLLGGSQVWTEEQEADIADWLEEISAAKKLINHNIIYDVLVIENNLHVDLTDLIYSDTILLKHTLDEEPPFALKELASITLGPWATKAQEAMKESVIRNGGKYNEETKEMYKADMEILAEYCMWDVLLTLELFKIFEKRLKEEGLEKLFYEEEVMPLYRECTIPMKRRGFNIDLDHFKKLKNDIETDLIKIEDQVITELKPELKPFLTKLLDKEIPVNKKGNFPKALADHMGIPLPIKKTKDKETGEITESVTIAKPAIIKQKEACPEYSNFYDWLLDLGELEVDPDVIWNVREAMYVEKKNNAAEKKDKSVRYAFNLNSSDHLAYYFFDLKGYEAKGKTPSGKPQVNADFIDDLTAADEIAQKIIDFKKLQKLLGTYVNGIISRQIDGIIYSSMLQFGTTSGRYSSRNPNLQNLPRIKDDEAGLSPFVLAYVNAIRRGFVAPEGYKIVNADFSQLEPCCFATMSGDQRLQDVFHKGEDLYSRVAIDVFKMTHLSANKKDANFLKKVSPEFRNKSKVFTLAVPYGAEEARIGQAMNVKYKEASTVINAYLSAYPSLKKYMKACNLSAKENGFVKTMFGRVRHLAEAKLLFEQYGNELLDWKWAKAKGLSSERRTFKNLLNNAKNFPIQGLAAHIVNRAMIAISREFKRLNLDAIVVLQVHDEITSFAREDIAEQVKDIVRRCMEHTTKIAVPLIAEPLIADNWAEAK